MGISVFDFVNACTEVHGLYLSVFNVDTGSIVFSGSAWDMGNDVKRLIVDSFDIPDKHGVITLNVVEYY